MPYTDYFRTPSWEEGWFLLLQDSSRTDGGRINSRRTPRPLNRITALVLHQTGNPSHRCGNDPWRYRGVRTHFVITPDGTIVQNHHENVYCNASDRLNSFTVAVEFVGNFRSERGRWWRADEYGADRLASDQVMAGRWLVLYLKETLGIRDVFAHRQGNDGKNCCGPDVWYHVGQWAQETQGIADRGPEFKVRGGAAIPRAWRTWNRAPWE